jgi:hypothetical protein
VLRRFSASNGAWAVVLVIVVAWVTGCASAKPVVQAPASSAPGSQAPASSTATAGYWPTLNGINAKLAADIRQLRSARTPTAVSSAVTAAEADVYLDFFRLAGMSPPSVAQAAHDALVGALREFRGVLSSTGSAADAYQVCAGYSALELLSSSTGAAQLRAAEAQMATINPTTEAQAGSFLLAATPYTHRRLADGTLVKQPTSSGLGQLTVHNNNDQDTVVSLVPRGSDVATMALYVRAKSSATTTGVADGAYQVYYTTGVDWDRSEHLFTRYCDFERLNKTIDFTATPQGNGVTGYTTEQITLHTIFAGNVTASRVPADKFPAS